MKSIRAKLSRPKIPKIFRKSKGESSVAESESKESLKSDKKYKRTEEEEVVPSLGSEPLPGLPSTANCKTEPPPPRPLVPCEVEIDITEMEPPRKLSSSKVQPTLAPSQTTERVNLSSVEYFVKLCLIYSTNLRQLRRSLESCLIKISPSVARNWRRDLGIPRKIIPSN